MSEPAPVYVIPSSIAARVKWPYSGRLPLAPHVAVSDEFPAEISFTINEQGEVEHSAPPEGWVYMLLVAPGGTVESYVPEPIDEETGEVVPSAHVVVYERTNLVSNEQMLDAIDVLRTSMQGIGEIVAAIGQAFGQAMEAIASIGAQTVRAFENLFEEIDEENDPRTLEEQAAEEARTE